MFSRAAPVVVEEIKNAEALFGDNTRQHNPATAQENGGCNYRDTRSPCRLRLGPQKGEYSCYAKAFCSFRSLQSPR